MISVAETSPAYFRASGLRPDIAIVPGTFLARAAQIFTPQDVVRLLTQGKIPDKYFIEDAQVESHLQFCETLSNVINEYLMGLPECVDLAKVIEQSLDHGWNHFRRVEKHYKTINAKDRALRADTDYLYYAFSAFSSIRIHDLIEVYTGVKEGHDGAAALFAYGFLNTFYPHIVDLTQSRDNSQPIPKQDWDNLSVGTAFICLHHSKPEKIPEAKQLLATGLFNPQDILNEVKRMAVKQNKTIYEFFPPYGLIKDFITQIEEGQITSPPILEDHLLGLIKQTRVMAAADKLDGTFPTTLAATRTILTRPDRAFYLRIPEKLTLEQELQSRIADGGSHESACDLNRVLFELTRTKTFDNLSGSVSYLFRVGLEARSQYFLQTIPAFLEGNLQPYLSGYDEHEHKSIGALLLKVGVDSSQINNVLQIEDPTQRHKVVRLLLKQNFYDGKMLDEILYIINGEKAMVESALQNKFSQLQVLLLSQDEKSRIINLLEAAVHMQRSSIYFFAGPTEIPDQYNGYYWVDTKRWQLK